jgi:hypothetical protein
LAAAPDKIDFLLLRRRFRDAAAGSLDGGLGALGDTEADQLHGLVDRPGKDHLGGFGQLGHQASLLEHQHVDDIDWQGIDVIQTNFSLECAIQGNEAAFGQAPRHGHLAAFETDLVEAAGA